jgi:hypothetical protein
MGSFEQLGRRHWRWRGEVPGAPEAVRSAVLDAIRTLNPAKVEQPNASTIVARVGGVFAMSWAATEEIKVKVEGLPGRGSSLEIESRSVQLSLTDSGRNRNNIVVLLSTVGINER